MRDARGLAREVHVVRELAGREGRARAAIGVATRVIDRQMLERP